MKKKSLPTLRLSDYMPVTKAFDVDVKIGDYRVEDATDFIAVPNAKKLQILKKIARYPHPRTR